MRVCVFAVYFGGERVSQHAVYTCEYKRWFMFVLFCFGCNILDVYALLCATMSRSPMRYIELCLEHCWLSGGAGPLGIARALLISNARVSNARGLAQGAGGGFRSRCAEVVVMDQFYLLALAGGFCFLLE